MVLYDAIKESFELARAMCFMEGRHAPWESEDMVISRVPHVSTVSKANTKSGMSIQSRNIESKLSMSV